MSRVSKSVGFIGLVSKTTFPRIKEAVVAKVDGGRGYSLMELIQSEVIGEPGYTEAACRMLASIGKSAETLDQIDNKEFYKLTFVKDGRIPFELENRLSKRAFDYFHKRTEIEVEIDENNVVISMESVKSESTPKSESDSLRSKLSPEVESQLDEEMMDIIKLLHPKEDAKEMLKEFKIFEEKLANGASVGEAFKEARKAVGRKERSSDKHSEKAHELASSITKILLDENVSNEVKNAVLNVLKLM